MTKNNFSILVRMWFVGCHGPRMLGLVAEYPKCQESDEKVTQQSIWEQSLLSRSMTLVSRLIAWLPQDLIPPTPFVRHLPVI